MTHEFGVGPVPKNPASLQHHDEVSHAHRRESCEMSRVTRPGPPRPLRFQKGGPQALTEAARPDPAIEGGALISRHRQGSWAGLGWEVLEVTRASPS
jgi:hypothetical protein